MEESFFLFKPLLRVVDTMAKDKKASNGANLGFEEKMWQAADKLILS
jgi:hypothetical protein